MEEKVFYEARRKQRKLRILKNTLGHRETFLKLRKDILKKIIAEGSDPGKIARLGKGILKEKENIKTMRQQERELEAVIAKYPDNYLGPEADLLSRFSPSESIN